LTSPPQSVAAPTTSARAAREQLLECVEERIHAFVAAERALWSMVEPRAAVPIDALAKLIDAGGKRIRPAFCVSGYLAAGGDPDDSLILDAAAALELLHACALIHDDVLDDSPMRRGQPTVHASHAARHRASRWHGESRRFGDSVAILAGDLAIIYADRLMARAPARSLQLWGELRTELVIGQYLDVAVAAEAVADPELVQWIALCKSGRYTIHRPLALGAGLAGRHDLAPAFEEYGQALGEAFQLRDDLIGAFGDDQVAGKPVGLDLQQRKMTELLALAIERDERVRAYLAGDRTAPDAWTLRELLVVSGVVPLIEDRIDRLVDVARQAIERAELDPAWRLELAQMAVDVTHRDR
jgi:geranylgeranyl diphosphate synthase, type I